MLSTILEKLQNTVDNPGFYRPLTTEEQAELFLLLFAPKPKLFKKPKVIQGIDGKTPVADRDYLSKETAQSLIADLTAKTKAELESIIANKLSTISNGKDAVITDELIERIAELAQSMIELPDFPTLITMEPESIRNALELLQDDERLDISAIKGLDEYDEVARLAREPRVINGGGVSKNWVTGYVNNKYKLVTSNYTITADDNLVCGTGNITITPPTAVGFVREYIVKNVGNGIVTVATTGGQTIDEELTAELIRMEVIAVRSTLLNWLIV